MELQTADIKLETPPKSCCASAAKATVVKPEPIRLSVYKPIFIIAAYLIGLTLLREYIAGAFLLDRWMNNFMAGFFLTFSFFKLLDLKGFADSYLSYDIVAKQWPGWGYVYSFIELALGIAFFIGFQPVLTNAITFGVMSISLIGVLQAVTAKKKIKCACLGSVFNLPMSTITLIEDGLMIAMSAYMLFMNL